MAQDKAAATPETMGARIRYIRELLGCTRAEFSEMTGLGASTIKAYESDAIPASSKAILTIVRNSYPHGAQITEQWLMHGRGEPPFLLETKNTFNPEKICKDFTNKYDEAEVVKINTTQYAPQFLPGDCILVTDIIHQASQLTFTITLNANCLVWLTDSESFTLCFVETMLPNGDIVAKKWGVLESEKITNPHKVALIRGYLHSSLFAAQ